jgi:hypothetical protein
VASQNSNEVSTLAINAICPLLGATSFPFTKPVRFICVCFYSLIGQNLPFGFLIFKTVTLILCAIKKNKKNPFHHGRSLVMRLSQSSLHIYVPWREGVPCIIMTLGSGPLIVPQIFIQTGPPYQIGSLVRHPRAVPSRGYRVPRGIENIRSSILYM